MPVRWSSHACDWWMVLVHWTCDNCWGPFWVGGLGLVDKRRGHSIMNWKTVGVIALIVLLGIAGCFYLYQQSIDKALQAARLETAQAENELQRVAGLVEVQRVELARVQKEADKAIQDATGRINTLTGEASTRAGLIVALQAENTRLRASLLNTITLPVEEPLPPDELLSKAEELYFPRTFTDSGSALFPADLVQVMIAEVEQRRALDFNNSSIIVEQGKQLGTLQATIAEHQKQFLALDGKFNSQALLVDSLEAEVAQSGQVITSLKKQIGLYEKQFWLNWKVPGLTVGGLAVGYLIYKAVK